jgi:hypothetical protein
LRLSHPRNFSGAGQSPKSEAVVSCEARRFPGRALSTRFRRFPSSLRHPPRTIKKSGKCWARARPSRRVTRDRSMVPLHRARDRRSRGDARAGSRTNGAAPFKPLSPSPGGAVPPVATEQGQVAVAIPLATVGVVWQYCRGVRSWRRTEPAAATCAADVRAFQRQGHRPEPRPHRARAVPRGALEGIRTRHRRR